MFSPILSPTLPEISHVPVPPHESIVKTGSVEKRTTVNSSWQERKLTLSTQALIIGSRNQRARDKIQLESIEEVNDCKTTAVAPTLGLERDASGLYSNSSKEADCADDMEWANTFSVSTNNERKYYFRVENEEVQNSWIDAIRSQQADLRTQKAKSLQQTPWGDRRKNLRLVYESRMCQGFICLVLALVFAVAIWDVEAKPEQGSTLRKMIDAIDLGITVLFIVELVVLFVLYNVESLLTSYWFLLDVVVVVASIAVLASDQELKYVRLLRILRVIKIFSRVPSLRAGLSAVSSALAPVGMCIIGFGVLTTIYAVVGTTLFADIFPERFGSVAATFLSLVQIATYDSWTGDLVRPLLDADDAAGHRAMAICFVSTFVISVSLILMNVVVAVLVENFVHHMESKKEEQSTRQAALDFRNQAGPIDGVLVTLANFTSHDHLRSQIRLLFERCDVDENGRLSFAEFRDGLAKLDVSPPIDVTEEEFEQLLAAQGGHVTAECFEEAMIGQVRLFAQRLMAQKMAAAVREKAADATLIFAVKMALADLASLGARVTAGQAETNAVHKLVDALTHPPPHAPHQTAQEDGRSLALPSFCAVQRAATAPVKPVVPRGQGQDRSRSEADVSVASLEVAPGANIGREEVQFDADCKQDGAHVGLEAGAGGGQPCSHSDVGRDANVQQSMSAQHHVGAGRVDGNRQSLPVQHNDNSLLPTTKVAFSPRLQMSQRRIGDAGNLDSGSWADPNLSVSSREKQNGSSTAFSVLTTELKRNLPFEPTADVDSGGGKYQPRTAQVSKEI